MAKNSFVQVVVVIFGIHLWSGVATAQDPPKLGSDFQSLFDGKSLEGWSGDEKFWSVSDGAITGQTTADNPTMGNTFLIWQGDDDGQEIENFELRVKYRIDSGNSGIQYRSNDLGEFRVSGYQADIDATHQYTGILYEERGRGILARRTQKIELDKDGNKTIDDSPTCEEQELLDSFEDGAWNQYIIKCNGSDIEQSINGYVTVKVVDLHDGKAKGKGILALQLHQGPPMKIQFKDIELKRIKK